MHLRFLFPTFSKVKDDLFNTLKNYLENIFLWVTPPAA